MALLRRVLIAALAGLAVLLIYLWVVLLSPFGYQAPKDLPPVTPGEHQVFVYGTLRFGIVRWLVYDRWGDPEHAVLSGYRRDGLDLEKETGARVEGYLLSVDAEELRELDRYERLGIRYRRVKVTLASGDSVWVYRRLAEISEEGIDKIK